MRPWLRPVAVVLMVTAPLVAVAGLELGTDRASREVAAEAARLRAEGRFPEAIAIDRALTGRTGPLHLLGRGAVDAATAETQQLLVDWAGQLAARGDVDSAVSVLAGATGPDVAERARQVRAAVLLAGARSAAAAMRFPEALRRLDQLADAPVPPDAQREADSLRVGYEIGAAPALTSEGRAADAVVLLDDAANHVGGTARTAARSELPAALLAAAGQSLTAQSRKEAQGFLIRLEYDFPSARETRTARTMLQAPQPVTGTLALRNGHAVSTSVRLSGRFRSVGASYLTSPPFYLASADSGGDFTFEGIPPGGPYVLEVLTGGEWTTSIDPSTNRPANSFTVDQLLPVDLGFITVP